MASLRTAAVVSAVTAPAGLQEQCRHQHSRKIHPSRRFWIVGNVCALQAALSAGIGRVSSGVAHAATSVSPWTAADDMSVEGLPLGGPAVTVGYSQQTLQVGDDAVPLSVWYPAEAPPTEAADRSTVAYMQRTSFGKLFRTFLKLPIPGWLFNSDRALPASGFVCRDAAPLPGARPAVILAHGFLGSRFDLLHLAERLAAKGVTVLAPEFPDARSGEVQASDALESIPATRADIITAVIGALGGYDVSGVGLVGHSAGSATISRLSGSYARVSIAGLVPQAELQPLGPFLVVHSSGDSTIRFQGGIEAVRARLAAAGYRTLGDEGSGSGQVSGSWLAGGDVQRAALLLSEPNHISFLSERSNEAMLATLAFLLPLARLLKLRLLDFDKYYESRDSRATAAVYVPLVEQFLLTQLGAVGESSSTQSHASSRM